MSQTTRTEEPLGNTKGETLGNRGKWATAQLAQVIVTSLPSLTLEMSNVWVSLLLLVFVYLFVWLVWTRARYKLLNTSATSHHKIRPECWWSWPCIFFKLSPNLWTLRFLSWWHQAKSWSLPIRSHNPLRELTIQIQGDRQRDRAMEHPAPPATSWAAAGSEWELDRQRRRRKGVQVAAATQAKALEWWKLVVCSSKNTHPLFHLFILGLFANYRLSCISARRESLEIPKESENLLCGFHLFTWKGNNYQPTST